MHTAAKRFLTHTDAGSVTRLRNGQSIELLVRDRAAEVTQEGDAVLLIEIANITASGRRSWELRAKHAGFSRIQVSGAQPFTLTIEVSP